MKKPRKFGLIIKEDGGKETIAVAKEVVSILLNNKARIFISDDSVLRLNGLDRVPRIEIPKRADMLIVLGGDGTLLGAARLVADAGIPLVGVHLGKLGFIMETMIEEVSDQLKSILNGKYEVDQRVMLSCQLIRKKRVVGKEHALNDLVITKGALSRMIDVDIFVDDYPVQSLRADGVIVATPTGSTAYSLSAGGPVIHPATGSWVITPICPQILSHRPIVLPQSVEIKLNLTRAPGDVFASLDGQTGWDMKPGDSLIIKKASKMVSLVKHPSRNYFDMLKNKLKLGRR